MEVEPNADAEEEKKPAALPAPQVAVAMDEQAEQAEQVARSLAKFFYEEGCFTALAASYPGYEPPMLPAAHSGVEEFFKPEPAFGGLAVQAVGYELGKAENPRVHVYLTKASKAVEKKLPKEVDGVPIVLSRMGRLTVCPGGLSGSHFFDVGGKVACGSSCAPSSERYAGTLGALIRIGSDPGALYCLSNNHVFAACNHTPVGQPIMSPAHFDSRPNQAPRHVANHANIVELRSGVVELVPVNQVDIAIAKVADNAVVTSWQGDAVGGYDTPAAIGAPVSGMKVMKFGRSTGLTLGTVEALTVSYVPLPYKCEHFKALSWFDNVWTVRGDNGPFAIPGDSGSLVVTEDGATAIGVIFAAAGDFGWIVPMPSVQNLFGGVTLVSGHHIP